MLINTNDSLTKHMQNTLNINDTSNSNSTSEFLYIKGGFIQYVDGKTIQKTKTHNFKHSETTGGSTQLNFADQNSTSFPKSLEANLTKSLKAYKNKPKNQQYLLPHQYLPYIYTTLNEKERGLLIYHGMGMGKSITAAAIADYFRENDPDRKIIILLAKSLEENFKKNIEQYLRETHDEFKNASDKRVKDEIEEKYRFISMNASNMFEQISRAKKTQDEIKFEKKLGKLTEELTSNANYLNNTLLIIDEAHNLFNAITNGSKNALNLYDLIMSPSTKNIKLLFLTGTPVINEPFELVPCFNMLKGKLFLGTDSFGKKQYGTLLPENRDEFINYFIKQKGNFKVMKNKNKFQNRIMGLLSYYGPWYNDPTKPKPNFPKELPTIVERVPMSRYQYSKYDSAREKELKETTWKKRASKAERFSASGETAGTYRVATRQISNYALPDYVIKKEKHKKTQKLINDIKDVDLKNINVYSPKFKRLLKNVQKHVKNGELGLIYSSFVSGEGLLLLARILELLGYRRYNINYIDPIKVKGGSTYPGDSYYDLDYEDTFDYVFGGAKKIKKIDKMTLSKNKIDDNLDFNKKRKERYYALITGDIDIESRQAIVDTFNKEENKNGKIINLLLVSSTGAEGLDLKNVRHIHIMEPFFNFARIEQVKTRAIRYKSHEMLSLKNRTVQPYIYLSDYPKALQDTRKQALIKQKKEAELAKRGIIKKKSTNEFEVKTLAEMEDTTDINLYKKSIQNKIIINKFLATLVEVSIDCSIHNGPLGNVPKVISKSIDCKMCSPNSTLSKNLYHPLLAKDMSMSDPCIPTNGEIEETIDVKEIIQKEPDTGEKFYYSILTVDNKPEITIYKYNPKIDSYTELDYSYKYYPNLLEQIEKKEKIV